MIDWKQTRPLLSRGVDPMVDIKDGEKMRKSCLYHPEKLQTDACSRLGRHNGGTREHDGGQRAGSCSVWAGAVKSSKVRNI